MTAFNPIEIKYMFSRTANGITEKYYLEFFLVGFDIKKMSVRVINDRGELGPIIDEDIFPEIYKSAVQSIGEMIFDSKYLQDNGKLS